MKQQKRMMGTKQWSSHGPKFPGKWPHLRQGRHIQMKSHLGVTAAHLTCRWGTWDFGVQIKSLTAPRPSVHKGNDVPGGLNNAGTQDRERLEGRWLLA